MSDKKFDEFRTNKFKEAWAKNIQCTRKIINDHETFKDLKSKKVYSWLSSKIEKAFDDLVFDDLLRDHIQANTPEEYFGWVREHIDIIHVKHLAKNPIRQSFDENCQKVYIIDRLQTHLETSISHREFDLPKYGEKSLCFDTSEKQIEIGAANRELRLKQGERTKSFDARLITNGITIYFIMKYFSDKGGAQDSQMLECVNAIQVAAKYLRQKNAAAPSLYFCFIVDGIFNTDDLQILCKKTVKSENIVVSTSSGHAFTQNTIDDLIDKLK